MRQLIIPAEMFIPFVYTDNLPYIGTDVNSIAMREMLDTFNINLVKLSDTDNQPK